jgi:hypothetical protein
LLADPALFLMFPSALLHVPAPTMLLPPHCPSAQHLRLPPAGLALSLPNIM